MYSVIGLEELPGSNRGSALPGGINNFGQVVGWASFAREDATLDQAFLWSEGVIQGLGFLLPERPHSKAHAINDRGLVVGSAHTPASLLHAFLWTELTGMEDLRTAPPESLGRPFDRALFSEAHAINNSGEVVGRSGIVDGGRRRAFIWTTRGHRMMTLMQLPDHDSSEAHAINDRGLVVGGTSTPDPLHAFIWIQPSVSDLNNPGMQDLGTLPGHQSSEAHAINHSGEVVGWSSTTASLLEFSEFEEAPAGDRHAFHWSENTGMQDLGTLPDHQSSEAHAINNSGEVVGGSFSPESGESEERSKHAFHWSENTGMQDLNDLIPPNSGWVLLRAQDINESGQILCEGFHTGPDNAQERRLCVLTPPRLSLEPKQPDAGPQRPNSP